MFQQELENTVGKAAQADKIASRTAKHISEKMNEDPADVRFDKNDRHIEGKGTD